MCLIHIIFINTSASFDMQLSGSLPCCQVNVKQWCGPSNESESWTFLSRSYFDLAEMGVRGTAKCHLKQGAYHIKIVVQVDEVQVIWLWH